MIKAANHCPIRAVVRERPGVLASALQADGHHRQACPLPPQEDRRPVLVKLRYYHAPAAAATIVEDVIEPHWKRAVDTFGKDLTNEIVD